MEPSFISISCIIAAFQSHGAEEACSQPRAFVKPQNAMPSSPNQGHFLHRSEN